MFCHFLSRLQVDFDEIWDTHNRATEMTTIMSYLYNELVWYICFFYFDHFLSCLQVDFDEIWDTHQPGNRDDHKYVLSV